MQCSECWKFQQKTKRNASYFAAQGNHQAARNWFASSARWLRLTGTHYTMDHDDAVKGMVTELDRASVPA